jgi:hypothetical protein
VLAPEIAGWLLTESRKSRCPILLGAIGALLFAAAMAVTSIWEANRLVVNIATPDESEPVPTQTAVHGLIQNPPEADDHLWLFVKPAQAGYWVYPISIHRRDGSWSSRTARLGPPNETRFPEYTFGVWLAENPQLIASLSEAARNDTAFSMPPQGVEQKARKTVVHCPGILQGA